VEPQSAQRRHCTPGALSRRWRAIAEFPCPRRVRAVSLTAKKRRSPRGTGVPPVEESWARCPCHGGRLRSPSHAPLCDSAPLRYLPFPFFPPPPWRRIRPKLMDYSSFIFPLADSQVRFSPRSFLPTSYATFSFPETFLLSRVRPLLGVRRADFRFRLRMFRRNCPVYDTGD